MNVTTFKKKKRKGQVVCSCMAVILRGQRAEPSTLDMWTQAQGLSVWPPVSSEAPTFPEDLSDSEEMFPEDITKWSSNDLMDKMESPEPEDTQGNQH